MKQENSVEKLEIMFGEQRPSRATVYRWCSEFNRGRASLTDKETSERPRIAVTPVNASVTGYSIKATRQVRVYRKCEKVVAKR